MGVGSVSRFCTAQAAWASRWQGQVPLIMAGSHNTLAGVRGAVSAPRCLGGACRRSRGAHTPRLGGVDALPVAVVCRRRDA